MPNIPWHIISPLETHCCFVAWDLDPILLWLSADMRSSVCDRSILDMFSSFNLWTSSISASSSSWSNEASCQPWELCSKLSPTGCGPVLTPVLWLWSECQHHFILMFIVWNVQCTKKGIHFRKLKIEVANWVRNIEEVRVTLRFPNPTGHKWIRTWKIWWDISPSDVLSLDLLELWEGEHSVISAWNILIG